MLKKVLGGLTLLAFVLAFAGFSLIVIESTNATSNVIWVRPVTVHHVCQGGGGILYTTYTERRWGEEINHPPDTWQSVWVAHLGGGGWMEKQHTDHGVEERCLVLSETEYKTIWREDDARCR